jgi:hypothetical protein
MASTDSVLAGFGVEVLQGVARPAPTGRMAAHGEALAAAGDGDVVGGLDLAQVLVERAAQVGQALVVHGESTTSSGFALAIMIRG